MTTSPVPGPKLILRQDLKPDQKVWAIEAICASSEDLGDLSEEE